MKKPTPYLESQSAADELREATDGLAAAEVFDPVIEAYKKDVDRTLLRANLKLTSQQRSEKFGSFMKGIYEMRGKANPGSKVWR